MWHPLHWNETAVKRCSQLRLTENSGCRKSIALGCSSFSFRRARSVARDSWSSAMSDSSGEAARFEVSASAARLLAQLQPQRVQRAIGPAHPCNGPVKLFLKKEGRALTL